MFWQSWSDRISRLFSGVRSSCDMFGEELGLVAGGARELLGLVLEGLARLLDLAVLRFHLLVLLDEELRLLLQLLVRRLQLLLAALQLFGERLRLLEQVLGAHVGVDRVDDDADRIR